MKKIFFALFILISIKSYSQQDSVYLQLSQLNLTNYVNKPVDSIISLLPSGYVSRFVGHLKSYKVRYYHIQYAGGTELLIFVKNYQYMNPYDPNRIWNFEQYRHEAIWYLRLWHPDYPPKTSTD